MTFWSSGTGMGMDNYTPKVREWEGKEIIPFPQTRQGKGMKYNHFHTLGNGRKSKKLFRKFGNGTGGNTNPFPHFGNGNQTVSFQGMAGNGNGGKKYNV